MFTGIIQSLGYLRPLSLEQVAITLPPGSSSPLLEDMSLGDSIAVDGICLTVASAIDSGFEADVSPETLNRTTLRQALERQTPVNLETSLRVGGKVGGHFVSGHVDGVGQLQAIEETANAWWLTFAPVTSLLEQWQEFLAPYLVSKGSIAVNGISLTVAECGDIDEWFSVAVIPHTFAETNLHCLKPGDWVNLEGDILGKYVARFLSHQGRQTSQDSPAVDFAFLQAHGYG